MATEKKAEAPRTVEDRLRTLYELQKIYSEISRIREYRGDLPREVDELGSVVEGLRTRLSRVQAELAEIKARRTKEQTEMERRQALVARYNEQLNEVTNSQEYSALTKMIGNETLEIDLNAKNMRDLDRAIGQEEEAVARIQAQIEEKNAILEDKRSSLATIVSETRQEEEALLMKAKALEPLLDERTLAAFKRIRQSARNGVAVVTVDRNACGGCFNRIPPQKQIEVRTHKKIIVCEYCGRIIIDPELTLEA